MSNTSRSKKAFKNLTFSMSAQALTLLLTFISRSLFVKILGVEYLGVSGLFTNILNVLSFVELGVGNAIIFSMYTPARKNDEQKLSALVNFYKKAYFIIGVVIAVVGVSLVPFLNLLITDVPNIKESISVIYILYLLNIVVSYFYIYKSSIINADQKNYVISVQNQIFKLVQCILQMLVLVLTHNFLLFLVIQVICTFLTNYTISKKADEMYPYLKENKELQIDKAEKRSIFEDVKSLFVYKIGDAVLNSTDNILITALVNISAVGFVSNYLFIINNVRYIICQGLSAVTSSVGNLNSTREAERQEEVFNQLLLIVIWIFGFLSVGYMLAIDDLITLWLGEKYVLDELVVMAIILQFYLMALEFPSFTYRVTMGLFVEGKYASMVGAVLNIILSIAFSKIWGLAGIFFATSVARLLTLGWVDPYLIYNRRFKKSVGVYFKKLIYYNVLILANYLIVDYILGFFTLTSVYGFILKVIIITVVFNSIQLLFLHKSKDFKALVKRLRGVLKKS